MRATIRIEYRTRTGINTWTGTCEGRDLATMTTQMIDRLKRRLRGKVTRIDRTEARRIPEAMVHPMSGHYGPDGVGR